MSSVFEKLSSIDVSNHVEKKQNFNYLSWAWAWAEVQKHYPATRKVYKNESGWNYHTDGKTAWVEVGVTIEGVEHVDMLPVMNHTNKSIPAGNITSFDVNKAIQRATVKALALHGLGLHIYAGEDLPMTVKSISPEQRESLIEEFEEGAVLWVEKKFGSILEQPEHLLSQVRKTISEEYFPFLQSEIVTYLKRRQALGDAGPHIQASVKKHLGGVEKVSQCSDIGLLKAYREYCKNKIDEMTKKEGESNE